MATPPSLSVSPDRINVDAAFGDEFEQLFLELFVRHCCKRGGQWHYASVFDLQRVAVGKECNQATDAYLTAALDRLLNEDGVLALEEGSPYGTRFYATEQLITTCADYTGGVRTD